ncbi:MAG: S53 family peptidase, partial [Edaphobacter sp.]
MATTKSIRPSTLSRAILPGSEKAAFGKAAAAAEKPAPHAKRITVSVLVKRKNPLKPGHCTGKDRLTHAQYRQTHSADPAAVKLVRAFAKEYDLAIEPDTPGPERRIIKLSGTINAMQKAFGVALSRTTHDGTTYRMREGAITLPSELIGSVEAVLGLDNRPQAEPHFRVAGEQGNVTARIAQGAGFASAHAGSSNASFTPVQIAQLYQFPAAASAAGQTIGIIELGGGFRTADIKAYFKSLGQKPPKVTAVSVDGGKNSPSNANSADGEVMLDIEVAAAVAPGANIAVYFAPNTDQGFINAIGTAVHDTTHSPSAISISWGSAEVNWTQQSMSALDAACQSATALGITVTAAAGDNGSTDGVSGSANNVDFPASSPHVLGCGGTKIQGSGSTITSEVVWNEQAINEGATGGGVSNVFSPPTWQSTSGVPKPT